jgi:hypothetical protein
MEQPVVKCSKHRPSYFTQKIKFTDEENRLLADAVAKFGTQDWHAVAKEVQTRNPRQCRERWTNYLDPQIALKRPWTPEEDELLRARYAEIGAKWKTLASFFPERSTNNVKGRFISLKRNGRRKRRGTTGNRRIAFQPPAIPPDSFEAAFAFTSDLDLWGDY